MDYIETTPHVSRLHHFRIVSFMGILLVSISLTASLWECRLQTNCMRIIFAGQGLLICYGLAGHVHASHTLLAACSCRLLNGAEQRMCPHIAASLSDLCSTADSQC